MDLLACVMLMTAGPVALQGVSHAHACTCCMHTTEVFNSRKQARADDVMRHLPVCISYAACVCMC